MNKIEIVRVYVEDNTIRYEVQEDPGLGLLRQERVDLFIRYHFNESFECDLSALPLSILVLPISLYIIPITYFYNVEVVIPEMDKELYDHLPQIYAAYSKIYGPFKNAWRGKITVKRVVENRFVGDSRYDKAVFFSGGVDACHAGISNPGRRSLLVSIPDIEYLAKQDGPLREEKFSLIKKFAESVKSDWLLISNNFNLCAFHDQEIQKCLKLDRGLGSPAYNFDGWFGIKYLANMCSIAPVAYCVGIKSLIMGSSYEEFEGRPAENLDGTNPTITNSVSFANLSFAEQDGLNDRRSKKVRDILEWGKLHRAKIKLWVCFSDNAKQCGFCEKCVRTQLNILCAGENPRSWGFDEFSEKKFAKFIRHYCYRERNPCWLWDIVETIEEGRIYPCLNDLLHWLKKIGYKKYFRRAEKRLKPTILKRLLFVKKYPHYLKVVVLKLIGR